MGSARGWDSGTIEIDRQSIDLLKLEFTALLLKVHHNLKSRCVPVRRCRNRQDL